MSEEAELGDIPGLITFLTILCAFAVLCNIVVLLIFALGRKKSSVDIFIINLAIADILLAGIALPLRLHDVIKETKNATQGNVVCKLIMFLPKFSVVVSISTMVAIAVDRYRAIVAIKHLLIRDTIKTVIIIWIMACCFSAPQLYEYSIYTKFDTHANKSVTSCGSEGIPENFETIYAVIILIFSYCVPVAVIIICYTSVIIYIWKSSNQFKNASQMPHAGQVLKKRMKVLKMLITITVAFTLLWAPYFVLFTMEEIMDLDDTSESAAWPHITKQIMVVFSTLSNPILYVIFDSEFRMAILKLFACKLCKQSKVSPVNATGS